MKSNLGLIGTYLDLPEAWAGIREQLATGPNMEVKKHQFPSVTTAGLDSSNKNLSCWDKNEFVFMDKRKVSWSAWGQRGLSRLDF